MAEEADTLDSIDADIGAAMAELRAEPTPVAQTAPEPTEQVVDDTAPPAQKPAADGRQRNPDGTFAKADETGQSPPAEVQEPAKTILPPRSWTAAQKAKFPTLDPDVQQEILRREAEMDQGKAQWDTKAEQFNKLEAVLAPVKDQLAFNGMSRETYVGALVNADQALRGPNKVQALQFLAQQYGINLGQPLQQGGPQPQPQGQQPFQGQPDPQIAAMQRELQDLRTWRQESVQSREAESNAQVQAQISAFAADPKHVYFDNVRADMAAMISAKPTLTLEEAYDRACNADPEIRGLIRAAQAPKPAAVQTRPNGASVTGGQRPGVNPVGRPSNGKDDYGDSVREAISQLRGEV